MTNDDWLLTRRVYVDLLEIRSNVHKALDQMRILINRHPPAGPDFLAPQYETRSGGASASGDASSSEDRP